MPDLREAVVHPDLGHYIRLVFVATACSRLLVPANTDGLQPQANGLLDPGATVVRREALEPRILMKGAPASQDSQREELRDGSGVDRRSERFFQ